MANNPLVSVVIPVYNVEKYIEKCINSVILQDYPFLEILVVNDGTLDNSMAIVETIKDDRIVIINKDNSGPSDSRNIGIEKAKGEFIYFVDSDDWIEPNLISSCLSQFKVHHSDIVYFDYYTDTYSTEEKLLVSEKSYLKPLQSQDTNVLNIMGYVWNKMYRVSFLKENNLLYKKELNIYEDIDFNLRCFQETSSIIFLERTLIHYSNRQVKTIIKSYNPKNIRCFNIVQDSLSCFFEKKNYSKELAFDIQARFVMICLRYQLDTVFRFSNLAFSKRTIVIQSILNELENINRLAMYKANGLKERVVKYLCVSKNAIMLNLILSIKK